MIARLILSALALASLLVATTADARGRKRTDTAPAGRFVEMPRVASKNIGPVHVTIWLPPGYGRGKQRYPVIYMNDGQNVFFPKQSGYNKVWAADKAMLRLLKAGEAPPAMVVAIWNLRDKRSQQYFPEALYDALPPEARAQATDFVPGRPFSDAYLRFLTAELKPMIDQRYRTMKDRAHTMIAGSSLGGLISLYAIAEYPQIFGAAACVSTHWPLVDPGKVGVVDPAIMAVWAAYLTNRLGPPAGRRIWFDHGDQTLDQFYGPWQSQIDARLGIIGWQPGADFKTTAYPGAAHEENAWAARLDEIFTWLLTPPPE